MHLLFVQYSTVTKYHKESSKRELQKRAQEESSKRELKKRAPKESSNPFLKTEKDRERQRKTEKELLTFFKR